jgi:hypothetical protein
MAFGTVLTKEVGLSRCKGLNGQFARNCRLWNSQMQIGDVYYMSNDALNALKER